MGFKFAYKNVSNYFVGYKPNLGSTAGASRPGYSTAARRFLLRVISRPTAHIEMETVMRRYADIDGRTSANQCWQAPGRSRTCGECPETRARPQKLAVAAKVGSGPILVRASPMQSETDLTNAHPVGLGGRQNQPFDFR